MQYMQIARISDILKIYHIIHYMQYGQIESLTEHFQNTSLIMKFNTAFFTCIYIHVFIKNQTKPCHFSQ